MACIIKRKGAWRALVEKRGIRKSMSFRTEAEAVDWGSKVESEIEAGNGDAIRRLPTGRPVYPKVYPTPALTGVLNKDEILERRVRSIPVCGVYFLISGDDIIYIGQSIDVHARIAQHRADKKSFDHVTIIECDPGMLMLLESKYILSLQPPMNFGADGRLLLSYARRSVELA